MTATTVKSTKATALQVTLPPTLQDAKGQGARVNVIVDTIEAATTSIDEAADVILMCPVRSNQSIVSLKLYNDDLDTGGTAGAVDIGVYNGDKAFKDGSTAYAAFAVIDVDAFASAVTTLTAANTAGVEVRYEAASAVSDIANASKPLWEVLGLASDPNKVFLIGVTVTTAMTTPAAGTITLVAQVVQ